ncbi:glycerophosphodiester phosphodiesterase [Streptomyces sp. ST2-7A]|uniref:glycerophosphodiester phosphodiesterase n=1 Tax=Streptomyces sp. ST2-7A TaxID=2907214 RepID=UPI001F411D39|nr:glycerophosphodiester phosphodiesterase [Streptomyces sp. ST2-7A]MCE7079992.1 glycerophosphodiester phosphodiesterase [Streptomyces sp. ST2-7A]
MSGATRYPAGRPADAPGRTLVVAHRGDPYRVRENTLASFRSAIAEGADAIELDVRLSRDGVPVVVHDPGLKRLWGVDRAVADLTVAEIREASGGGVPTLVEALGASFPTRVLIDLPEPDGAIARAAVATVAGNGSADRVYWCGDPAALLAVRAADPGAEIALTWKRSAPVRAGLVAEVRPRWLNYRFGLLDRATVERAREAGYLLGAWTVDSGRTMRGLLDLGVDAITSNRPGTLRRAVERAARQDFRG